MKRVWIETGIVAVVGLVLFAFFVQVEAFEWFYEATREYEALELDEIGALIIALCVCCPGFLIVNKRELKRAIAKRREVEQSAREAVRHDPLTGLRNRRFLAEHLDEQIQDATSAGIIQPGLAVLDIDRFKPINDVRGHHVGDLVLRHVAERIASACLPGQIPIRFGGDGFAVLFTAENGSETALALALRIKKELAPTFEVENQPISLTCSCGITLWHPDKGAAEVINDAEQALARAKKKGQGQFSFYDPEIGETLREQASIEVDLRQAIPAGEVHPYFQPIFSLSPQELIGFEVLARWHCPKRGVVTPDKFIGIAEDCGLIGPLTWDLISRSCQIALSWPKPYAVSFNVSPIQFRDADFVARLKNVLGKTGFPPNRIVLEITESALIADMECAQIVFGELNSLGVRLSLDDFGTGYSSLAMLNDLRFDNVKIDRSFVTGLEDGSHSAKIVDGILALANSLGLSVTAEGIESSTELAFLDKRHCPQGQGFLFAKPLAQPDVSVYVEKIANSELPTPAAQDIAS